MRQGAISQRVYSTLNSRHLYIKRKLVNRYVLTAQQKFSRELRNIPRFFLLSKTGRIPEGWGKHGYKKCLEMQEWRGTERRKVFPEEEGTVHKGLCFINTHKHTHTHTHTQRLRAPFGVCLTERTRVSGARPLLPVCPVSAEWV